MALLLGCAERPSPSSPTRWVGDVEALLEVCLPCHADGGSAPRLDRFEGLAACREDGTGWLRPGDPDSPLLTVLTRADHRDLLTAQAQSKLRAWVVDGRGVFRSAIAHPPGFAIGDNPDSHLHVLRAANYVPMLDPSDEQACASCHGVPRELGGAVACTTCHPKTLNACDACHGADGDPRPRKLPCGGDPQSDPVGAHAVHGASTRLELPDVACESCHVVPKTVAAEGHLADGVARAEVRFDPTENPEAIWDASAGTCSDVACHAGKQKTWTRTASVSPRCDTCHGDPPEGHANNRCPTCHINAFTNGRVRVDRHLDDRREVPTDCDACHGDGPPPGLGGMAGAHQAHFTASEFRGPVACNDCHLVPTMRDEAGHIDTDLPVEVVLGSDAATGGGTVPAMYDPATQTCQTACHGASFDAMVSASPPWQSVESPQCGDCHGLPPTLVRDGADMHPPSGLADCGACHRDDRREPATDPAWNLTPGGLTVHINGCVNLVDGCRQ